MENFTSFVSDLVVQDGSFRVEITQDDAIQECNQLDGFTLGPIENAEQYSLIRQRIRSNEELFSFDTNTIDHFIGFFIGLEALNGHDGFDTSVFTFVDPSADSSLLQLYHGNVGEFPWNVDEPNDVGGNQNCLQMLFSREFIPGFGLFTNDGLVEDTECFISNGFICRGPCALETESPTQSPSLDTDYPTQSPFLDSSSQDPSPSVPPNEQPNQDSNEESSLQRLSLGALLVFSILFFVTLVVIGVLKQKVTSVKSQLDALYE